MFGSRKYIYLGVALLAAACSGKETLPGEKTPLTVEATLSGQAETKASAGDFAEGDKILVYLRHMNGTTPVTVDRAPLLAGFTMDADKKPVPDTPLYWDDFSSNREPGQDIRETGHGLQAYYGYCYNGGAPTSLEEATGVLEWTIGDQTSAQAVQKADLLWAEAQSAVAVRKTVSVPFTHAMSQISVTLTLADGFENVTEPLKNTVLTLNSVNTVTTFTAPAATFTSDDANPVEMFRNGTNFVAIVAPGTALTKGAKLLDITDVDGNNYILNITDAMMDASHWNATATQPGVNYHLDITLSKTAITVQASLADWTTVNATGTGEIQFPDDVVTLDVAAGSFESGASFDLYRYEDTPGEKSATVTYDEGKWVSDPVLYWPNASTSYFFRAVMNPDEDDVLWATTPAHNGFAEGAAIAPRTGNVPLAFEHVKSRLSVVLETSATASAVNLEGATIAISNLSTEGTLNVDNGNITPGTAVENAFPAATEIKDKIVIPQTITNASVITITLSDGTTYKLQLNQCVDENDSAIDKWVRGKSYTYTIHLELEEVSFRALVKDWTVVTGSGNANLEWD